METFEGSNINKISQEYQEWLEEQKLSVGQTVQFRLLDGVLNPDPDERRKPGKEIIWKQADFILGRDTIKDPHSGKLVKIGVVKSFENGNPVYAKKTIYPKASNGFITIVGGNVEDEKWYEYMLICNENESNEHRDKNIHPKFKLIDAEKENREKNRKFDLLTDMLQLIKDFTPAERKEVAAAYGWDIHSSDEVITGRLREIVMKDAEGFSNVVGNKHDLNIRATINEALQAEVITYAPLENKYTFTKTGEVICTLTRSESVESKEQFLEWIKTHSSGKAVLKNIKTQLKSPVTA